MISSFKAMPDPVVHKILATEKGWSRLACLCTPTFVKTVLENAARDGICHACSSVLGMKPYWIIVWIDTWLVWSQAPVIDLGTLPWGVLGLQQDIEGLFVLHERPCAPRSLLRLMECPAGLWRAGQSQTHKSHHPYCASTFPQPLP